MANTSPEAVALKRIEVCRREKQSTLDLSRLELSVLPPEIGQLASLTELDLEANKLIRLPPEIGQLTALTSLSLRWNQLTTLPPQIGQLTALTKLDLRDNQLVTLPGQIGELSALEYLRLDNNELTTLPSEIGQLTALTTLDLESNELTSLPPEIGRLTALTKLNFGSNRPGNRLTTLPPEFWQLTALTELSFWNNLLTVVPPEIGRLQALIELSLGHNEIDALPPEIGQLRAVTELRLDNNRITTLPPEIGRLTALTTLRLDCNQLTKLPPEIGQLTALTTLDVHANQLDSLPPEIGQLTALTQLELNNNQLTRLPAEIGQLTALTQLKLDENQLTTLPPEIGRLTALTEINVEKNHLATLPPEIGQLALLTEFNLRENRLTTLPPEIGDLKALQMLYLEENQLANLPIRLKELPSLRGLYLRHNPALGLSPSVIGASTKALLDYYFGRQISKTRQLNEVKLIMVGRGGAGKSSTVRALRDLSFSDDAEPTPGIALCDWTMRGCKGEPVTAHIWDFAGQIVTHALHQFFFSSRSVYVVVLTGRENSERQDAEYWLRLIKAFGTDRDGHGPPVLVALNKWELIGSRPRVDRGALQERFPFIRAFVETDCRTNLGIDKLNAALCAEVDRLPWVRETLPETWDAVRIALTKSDDTRPHLTYAEYRQLCAKHGVTDERQQDSLSEILHNLGTALNYRTDPRLREATVLKPEWLTSNVYALMRQAEANEGVLKQADVDQVLSDEENMAMRAYLMQIMERFEIAYSRPLSRGIWSIPQALPDDQPPGASVFRAATDATRLRYTYSALPEGLVARAIVRLHEFIEEAEGKKQQWGSGAILARDGARALLCAESQDRQVLITVTGPTKSRQQLAGLCQAEMRDIHRDIRGLDPTEESHVQGNWVETATLEADERNNRETGIATKDRGTVMVNPEEANNAFSRKPARTDDHWKPTVFISYSKSNVTQRKRLESELKILKNEGLLAGHWHDRMIDPGDTWDDIIQSKLADADVVIILASAAALSTDYITDHEIPKALELHNASKTVVVPLILEKCRWDKTALGPLNALPEKARPLNSWKPQSDGWNTIADGLAKVLRKLIENGGKKSK